MAKELLVYTSIFDFIAEEFVAAVEENKSEDLIIRVNSPGGSVFAGWSMIGKLKEHTNPVTIKIDGNASSMGTVFAAMFPNVIALDVTHFMIHKAVMFVETDQERETLDKINADLQKALNQKIDNEKLKELKNITIDEIFSAEFDRVDIWLDANEALEIGLISEVTQVVEKDIAAINKKFVAINEKFIPLSPESNSKGDKKPKKKKEITTKSENMTLAELKSKHPELYKEIHEAGITAEKNRVEAWLVYADVDAEAVKKGIEDGGNLSPKASAEFARKSFSANAMNDNDDDNDDDVDTDDADDSDDADPENKKVKDFEASLRKFRKNKKEAAII